MRSNVPLEAGEHALHVQAARHKQQRQRRVRMGAIAHAATAHARGTTAATSTATTRRAAVVAAGAHEATQPYHRRPLAAATHSTPSTATRQLQPPLKLLRTERAASSTGCAAWWCHSGRCRRRPFCKQHRERHERAQPTMSVGTMGTAHGGNIRGATRPVWRHPGQPAYGHKRQDLPNTHTHLSEWLGVCGNR